ncbi:MAG: hypothetical protein WC717_04790 [Candidatus Micrarchaeia archaeon]|jgi:hypothetical protein
MPSEAYSLLDRQWKSACKVLLGAEPSELKAYEAWLASYMAEHKMEKVGASEAMYQFEDFGPSARKMDFASVDFMKKYPPLSANEMKDIDSIAQALGERVAYTGNIFLGNSRFVENSTNVLDSTYVYKSAGVSESSYVAYATDTRLCKMIFGGDQNAQSEMLVGSYINRKGTRCLEAWACDEVSDVYYSSYCIGCSDIMFSFNLVGHRNCIGNCPLPKEKYLEVKKRLLSQLADELGAKKKLPSLAGFVPPLSAKPAISLAPKAKERQDMARIEREFSNTSKLILGSALPGGIDRYSKWLSRNIFEVKKAKSALSGSEIYTSRLLFSERAPKERLIGAEEAPDAGTQLKLSDADAASLELGNVRSLIGKIAFFCCERRIGMNENNIRVPIQINSSNCYSVSNIPFGKDCAFCTWPRNSEHCYGSARTFACAFVIRCFNSLKLSRCLECDCCRDCTGSYFCHNCENVHDSMFCFNAKNLRYAIGNAEVGKEVFERAKKMLLAEITSSLEKTQDYRRSIYNLKG